ncbi:MAG: HlyD family efflux transporter periplasmic adaptor subunit [Planctomycetales bacterium]|nr:HlyD family efflux transporter periplasmic adaptor subunit [Planctomycetales bacterium]
MLITVLLGLSVLAGAGYVTYRYGGFGSAAKQEDIVTTEVIRGPFDHIVLEQGEIESSSNIDVVCQVKSQTGGGGGGTPILWVIEEGTYVKKGDKLVELDASALENQLKTQRIAVSSAEAQVISSEAAVRTAEIALQEYLEGTYMSERKAILSEIDVAQQGLLNAELKLSSAERLAAKGMFNKRQVQSEGFAVSNARNVLESAKARLEILDRLTKEKFKVQFESDIEAAKARLKSDASVLAEEEDELRDIEDQITKCVILSPAEGVVVHNNQYNSRGGGAEFVVEEGALVRERQTIIKLPDPAKMQVKASINEQNITLIAEGMAAKIKVNAVEGDMLARIKRVNKYPEPGSFFTSSVKKYSTFVEILEPAGTIRTGMTAEVRIFVSQVADALQIPVHGIYEYKGHHFCLKQAGKNKWETVPIEIGATNDKMVTIVSGLQEGDSVALNPRKHLNLLDLPEVDEVSDREKLAKIGANAGEPSGPPATPDGDKAAGGRGAPGAGAPGAGAPGAGGFNPQMIVDRIFASDTNGDGKLAGEKLDSLDERMK